MKIPQTVQRALDDRKKILEEDIEYARMYLTMKPHFDHKKAIQKYKDQIQEILDFVNKVKEE